MNASVAALCPACDAALTPPDACRAGAASCSAACGSRNGCALLACPGCGRTWPHPDRSRLAFRLARWLTRRQPATSAGTTGAVPTDTDAGPPSLATLAAGARGRITALRCAVPERLHQLTALGLVPGTEVHLQRRRPTYVVQVDETTLALDGRVAGEILLAPLDA